MTVLTLRSQVARTALFAANALLLKYGDEQLLSIPYDENDPTVSDSLNDLLARTYVFGEDAPVKDLLRARGLSTIPRDQTLDRFPELRGELDRPGTSSVATRTHADDDLQR